MNGNESTSSGWMDFLQAEGVKTQPKILSASEKKAIVTSWIAENPDKSKQAAVYLTELLQDGPIHGSLLSKLAERYSIPKPISSWVRMFPQFRYFSGAKDNAYNGAPAVALAARAEDAAYWKGFKTKIVESAVVESVGSRETVGDENAVKDERRFSGVVAAPYQTGNKRCVVKFENCVDASGTALPELESVLHDFDGSFMDQYQTGETVYGKFVTESDGRIKIISLSKEKPLYQNGSDEELAFIQWMVDKAKELGLNCTERNLVTLHTAAKIGLPILLSGRPGCGKRTLAEFYGRIVTGRPGPHVKPLAICLQPSDGLRISVTSDLEKVHLTWRDEFCVIELPVDKRARDLTAVHELDVSRFPLGYQNDGRPVQLDRWRRSVTSIAPWDSPFAIGGTECRCCADVFGLVWDIFDSFGVAPGHAAARHVNEFVTNYAGRLDSQRLLDLTALDDAIRTLVSPSSIGETKNDTELLSALREKLSGVSMLSAVS